MQSKRSPLFIAEVKIRSPFGYVSTYTWDDLFEVAATHGEMLSIHTDERWGGSFTLLQKAISHTSLPVLAKGIHAADEEIEQALSCGAHRVLVVGRIPREDLIPFCYIEPYSLEQLVDFSKRCPQLVWNSRDLKTGLPKRISFRTARAECPSSWLCQASNISTLSDVDQAADAFIVGEKLIDFVKSL